MTYQIIDIDATDFSEKYHISKLAGKVLAASRLDEEKIRDILDQNAELSTSSAQCVKDACRRILEARENREKVFIGGDYDADGICSTAIMKDTLDRLKIANGYYIPDRFREGYGLHKETVQMAIRKGYTLFITVDNGVKAFEAIEEVKRSGADIIVTDHHQIDADINADIIVHPDYMEEAYKYCSGAGVALQISRTLLGDVPEHTELAAIAAIGDVMPLYRETRKIVKNGLDLIRRKTIPAVESLFRGNADSVDEVMVAFQIVPKLNSVGRMDDNSNVNTLVPFLLSKDINAVYKYSQQLEQVNNRRKQLSAAMVKQAENMLNDDHFQIIYDDSFHEGICGLAAGKLANSMHMPVLIMADNGDRIKGSGRSVPGFDLFRFFSEGFEFEAFGGHEQAVGLSIKKDYFEQFCRKVNEKMESLNFHYEEPDTLTFLINEDDITFDEVTGMEMLYPLPKDVIQPIFTVKRPTIDKIFQNDKILKYSLKNAGVGYDAILFGRQDALETLNQLTGRLSINRFRDQIRLQMIIDYFE